LKPPAIGLINNKNRFFPGTRSGSRGATLIRPAGLFEIRASWPHLTGHV
jgi:hypothetical protein